MQADTGVALRGLKICFYIWFVFHARPEDIISQSSHYLKTGVPCRVRRLLPQLLSQKHGWTGLGKPFGNGKEFTGLEPEAYFSHPAPSQISCTLPSTVCICAPFLGHTVRFWRIGKERLGVQSLTKGRGRWDGGGSWHILYQSIAQDYFPTNAGTLLLQASSSRGS